MKGVWLVCLGGILISLLGCARLKVAEPAGFAPVGGSGDYKAVSPEGVLYKVRYVRNYPVMNVDFWARALKKQMESSGYQFIKEEKFAAGKREGVAFEWGAPYGNANYIYLTSLVVIGKRIVVAEAAAEFKLYEKYRDSLVKSLSTIEL